MYWWHTRPGERWLVEAAYGRAHEHIVCLPPSILQVKYPSEFDFETANQHTAALWWPTLFQQPYHLTLWVYIYIYTYIHIPIVAPLYIYVYIYEFKLYVYTYTYIYIYIYCLYTCIIYIHICKSIPTIYWYCWWWSAITCNKPLTIFFIYIHIWRCPKDGGTPNQRNLDCIETHCDLVPILRTPHRPLLA